MTKEDRLILLRALRIAYHRADGPTRQAVEDLIYKLERQ
jgi:hypothetical protein